MLHLPTHSLTTEQLKAQIQIRLKEDIEGMAVDQPDIEAMLNSFENNIAILDKISDGVFDDPITAQALCGLHASFCDLHAQLKARIFPNVE